LVSITLDVKIGEKNPKKCKLQIKVYIFVRFLFYLWTKWQNLDAFALLFYENPAALKEGRERQGNS
jgi:hypothetical protein